MSENFDEYWAGVDADLAEFPARPVIDPVPARITEWFTGYTVRLSGLDSYRLFGYFSVPAGQGPFPAVLETPRHGSVNHAPHYNDRLRYAVFTLMHRGQRLADSPFAAEYPGLFTLGIESPDSYVYRAIVADCLRGAEFLAGRPEVDRDRIGISGDDLALLTAARRPEFAAARVTSALLHDPLRRRHGTGDYPLEELNDHLRRWPEDEERFANTLRYFEPVRHAATVRARTLLVRPSTSPEWSEHLVGELRPLLDTYRRSDEDAADDWELDSWLAGRLGVAPLSRFAEAAR